MLITKIIVTIFLAIVFLRTFLDLIDVILCLIEETEHDKFLILDDMVYLFGIFLIINKIWDGIYYDRYD
jgi:hypothetical protein